LFIIPLSSPTPTIYKTKNHLYKPVYYFKSKPSPCSSHQNFVTSIRKYATFF
jgi:hypothetical protein